MPDYELHPERLATTDENGKRVYLYPPDFKGKYRTRRNWIQAILLFVFLALPWIKLNGKQALLLDVSNRHFEIFGLSLRAHNAPLFFFVLASAGFGLFFATSIWGRVWCGWACPQTVFIEGIYRRIERLIEGSAHKRHLLDAAPWDLEKLGKRTAKWALFVIATAIITHSFLAYFVGSGAITQMVMRPPSENWTSFLVILFSSAIVLFDFAWFREQFCIIACPYGRFQSVLMDENSLVIAYDQARGEPRWSTENKERAKASAAQLGDCVGCYRCVQVCPTGVDIRRGTQMECIACTSCIDACDEIMAKHKKPAGLIRYDSYNGLRGLPVKRLRIRTGIYIAIIAASLSALIYFLATLNPVDIKLLRAKDTPYSVVKQADGADEVINHYYLELSNQSAEAHSIELALAGKATQDGAEIAIAQKPIPLAAGQFARVDFFTKIPKAKIANGSYGTKLTIIDADSETGKATPYVKDLNLVGPFN